MQQGKEGGLLLTKEKKLLEEVLEKASNRHFRRKGSQPTITSAQKKKGGVSCEGKRDEEPN